MMKTFFRRSKLRSKNVFSIKKKIDISMSGFYEKFMQKSNESISSKNFSQFSNPQFSIFIEQRQGSFDSFPQNQDRVILFSIKRIQAEKKNPSKKKKKKKTFIQTIVSNFSQEQNITFDQKDDDFDRNKNKNRAQYNKIFYIKDAMTILLINKSFFTMKVFQGIEIENVATTKTLYQLTSKFKKKSFIKTVWNILDHKNDKFIDQSRFYFLTWLDRYQYGSSGTEYDKEFVFRKIFTKNSFKRFSKNEVNKNFRRFEKNQKKSRFRFFGDFTDDADFKFIIKKSVSRLYISIIDAFKRFLSNHTWKPLIERKNEILGRDEDLPEKNDRHSIRKNMDSIKNRDRFNSKNENEDEIRGRNEDLFQKNDRRSIRDDHRSVQNFNFKNDRFRDPPPVQEKDFTDDRFQNFVFQRNYVQDLNSKNDRFRNLSSVQKKNFINNRFRDLFFHWNRYESIQDSIFKNDRFRDFFFQRNHRNDRYESIQDPIFKNDRFRDFSFQRNHRNDNRSIRDEQIRDINHGNDRFRNRFFQQDYRERISSWVIRNLQNLNANHDRDHSRFKKNIHILQESSWDRSYFLQKSYSREQLTSQYQRDRDFFFDDTRFVVKENKRLQTINHNGDREKRLTYESYRQERQGRYFENFRFEFRQGSEFIQKSVKLRFSDVMKFDFFENTTVFFIRRFQHIAEIENEFFVLQILFMCLKRIVFEWHISLSTIVRTEMNQDLRIWKNEFLKKYRFNKFEFLKKAEIFIFKFDESFTFSQYLFKKTNMLHDAEIINENMLIVYFWKGLNVKLALTTSLRENEDTLKSFDRRIRQNESIGKKIHDFDKRRSEKSISKNFYSFKSRFQKSQQFDDLSIERVQKLLIKLSFKNKSWIKKIKKKKIKYVRKSIESTNVSIRRKFKRLCRRCQDFHWNKNCSDKDKSDFKNFKKIFLNMNDQFDDENIILNDDDLRIYETLKKKSWT